MIDLPPCRHEIRPIRTAEAFESIALAWDALTLPIPFSTHLAGPGDWKTRRNGPRSVSGAMVLTSEAVRTPLRRLAGAAP